MSEKVSITETLLSRREYEMYIILIYSKIERIYDDEYSSSDNWKQEFAVSHVGDYSSSNYNDRSDWGSGARVSRTPWVAPKNVLTILVSETREPSAKSGKPQSWRAYGSLEYTET